MFKYRFLDLCLSIPVLVITLPITVFIVIINYFYTNGSPLFLQERVGKNKKPFILVKFRTMKVGTKSVATHLAQSAAITKLGGFLRKSKIDELPQLINVIKGDMSLVGPRPNLFNQEELIKEREHHNIYSVLPGVTGLAQINNIDMSNPEKLAKVDAQMVKGMSIRNYFRYVLLTAFGKGSGDAIGTDR